MEDAELLAQRFERQRPQLRKVAYRMLGSMTEAEDAVQEAWLRLSRTDSTVENLNAWLTTVVARVALNMLRARAVRREQPLGPFVSDAIVVASPDPDPEAEAVLAESLGLALLVVLDTLAPAERLAFVLHDMFSVPFSEIAPIVERSPEAARQLASRARRRVRAASPASDGDGSRQREVVEAFLAATREGDFDALVAVLDPDVVLRVDRGRRGDAVEIRGARAVAAQAGRFRRVAPSVRLVLINEAPGLLALTRGEAIALLAFVVDGRTIAQIDILADRRRLRDLDLADVPK